MATATPDDWMERYEQQQLPMEPQDKTSVQPPPSTPQADVASASAAGDHEEAIVNEIVKKVWPQGIEAYKIQRNIWPPRGKHILATYDDDSIVVYQAFCPSIAKAAVRDQKFGGGGFSLTRMSWIKTNFLWMMYRCGWCTKPRQEHILAVRITLDGFNTILQHAKSKGGGPVRLQWDPDHTPSGENISTRRDIQLGLKGKILEKYASEWIVSITDVTPFVKQQHLVMTTPLGPQKKNKVSDSELEVKTPLERVYLPPDPEVIASLEIDDHT